MYSTVHSRTELRSLIELDLGSPCVWADAVFFFFFLRMIFLMPVSSRYWISGRFHRVSGLPANLYKMPGRLVGYWDTAYPLVYVEYTYIFPGTFTGFLHLPCYFASITLCMYV